MSSRRHQNARHSLFMQQKGLCYYCERPMLLAKTPAGIQQPPNLATLDHIIPQSAGGAKAPTKNCVCACRECNQQRGSKDARLFLFEKQGLA